MNKIQFILRNFAGALKTLSQWIKYFLPNQITQQQPVPAVAKSIPDIAPTVISDIPPVLKPIPATLVPVARHGFLACPIKANDAGGNPVTSATVKISALLDHSGTSIDPNCSSCGWGKRAKDKMVKAFNGEVGDGDSTSSAPFGYAKKDMASFTLSGINYVGVYDSNDKYGQKHYLNYDGHAGYDFPYPKLTPILAPADGSLFKASKAKDVIYGADWNTDHSFYIQHENGFLSWFRHCEKLHDNIEVQILSDFSKPCSVVKGQVVAYVGSVGTSGVHLHFEVRNEKNAIVDPYADKLWEI